MRIKFKAEGLAEIALAAREMSDKLADLNVIAPNLFALLQSDVDERFRSAPAVRVTGKAYGGVVWENLTEAYLKRNPRREGGVQLRDTGELAQSFQVGGYGNVAEVSPTELTFGTSLPKARGLAARRPLIVVHDELVEAIASLVTREAERPFES